MRGVPGLIHAMFSAWAWRGRKINRIERIPEITPCRLVAALAVATFSQTGAPARLPCPGEIPSSMPDCCVPGGRGHQLSWELRELLGCPPGALGCTGGSWEENARKSTGAFAEATGRWWAAPCLSRT